MMEKDRVSIHSKSEDYTKDNPLTEVTTRSCQSLNQYETSSLKAAYPQIIAAVIAGSFQISIGFIFSYSAILIPQIESTDSDIFVTKTESSWIASIVVVVVPIGSIIAGFLMERLGRLNTIKLAALPCIIGWSSIAMANNVYWILFGRILTGLGCAIGTGPAIVYITEISRPDLRGSLISVGPTLGSLGMLIIYAKGSFLTWRQVSWLNIIYTIIPVILIQIFVPESPSWLVSKGRIEEARASLKYLYKNCTPRTNNTTEAIENIYLRNFINQRDERASERESNAMNLHKPQSRLSGLLKPTGYKPMLILFWFFFIQQYSGIYITLFYAVTYFQDAGSSINAYHASILVGLTRFLMSLFNSWLLKNYKRRLLIMISTSGMAITISISGLFTKWIKEETSTHTWIPIACFLLYVCSSMIGMLPIPWTMTAELYHSDIRGMGQSISFSVAHILMFFAVQSYRPMLEFFGSSARVQWLFACVSLGGFLFALFFLPETYGKTLSEIEDHFKGTKRKIVDPSVSDAQERNEMLERHQSTSNGKV